MDLLCLSFLVIATQPSANTRAQVCDDNQGFKPLSS